MAVEESDPQYIKKITNVHDDDIHGISFINKKNCLISGSKDTTIKLFDLNEDKIKEISTNNKNKSYERWVTAIDTFEDGSLVAGYRNGFLLCKDPFTGYTFTSGFINQLDKGGKKIYKQKNMQRITGVKCLRSGLWKDYSALIGVPEQFYHYNFETNKIINSFSFLYPDWVYGFCQVNSNSVVVIHGCCLSLFKFIDDSKKQLTKWEMFDEIVRNPKIKQAQRPFISSVSSMDTEPEQKRVILSLFGGTTKVVNIETKQILHETHEHTGRVWQSAPLSPYEYMSCADDAMIKIWDMRVSQNSIRTYGKHPGRVSALALLKDYYFVAGTCPENPHESLNKGEFYFYDIRMGEKKFKTNEAEEEKKETILVENSTSNLAKDFSVQLNIK
jgi:WD40 repeat protein